MSAVRPEYATLEGRYIRLVPMTAEHLPALFEAIAHPIVFAGGYGGGPAGYRDTEESFVGWAHGYFDWARGQVYAVEVVSGPLAGALVGTTTMSDFDETFESAHIGWTAYDPRVWGTAVNAEAKRMLLSHAFDSGFGRVKIQADARNERSRAAIARIGATFEGIVRRDRPRADGTWRDSAVFSVIVDDWPGVRDLLDERLAAYEGRPITFRPFPSPTPAVSR